MAQRKTTEPVRKAATFRRKAREWPLMNGVSSFPFTIEEMDNPEPTQALIDLMKLPSIKVVHNK
jgi:hypothetical protein